MVCQAHYAQPAGANGGKRDACPTDCDTPTPAYAIASSRAIRGSASDSATRWAPLKSCRWLWPPGTATTTSGPYGWVLKRGVCTATVTASYTRDQALIVSAGTAGAVDTVTTAATNTFGYGLGLSSGGAGVAGTAQVYVNII